VKVLEDVRRSKIQINKYLADTQRTHTTEREVYGQSHPGRKSGDTKTLEGSKMSSSKYPDITHRKRRCNDLSTLTSTASRKQVTVREYLV